MRIGSFAIGGLLLLAACGAEEQVAVGPAEANVVYGADDRRDVYDHPDDGLVRVARESIVAVIPAARMELQPDGTYALIADTLQDSGRGVCADERFSNQPVAATCSGVLIADDLVLTAGHCIDSPRCASRDFVFNYLLEGPNPFTDLAPILESDVYSCSRVVLDFAPPSQGSVTPDFAIVELDRPVTSDHVPAAVRRATPLDEGDSLAMIGSGTGLPMKIDDGGLVYDAPGDYYVTNLDAFEGHSGSAVFDADDRLAGILVSGRVPDYVIDPAEGCSRVNTFDDSLAGEAVQNVAPVIDALCEAGEGNDDLCGEKACDGEPCGAPPVEPSPSPPVTNPGVVTPSSGGCAVARATPTPAGVLALLLCCFAVARVRRTTA